MNFLYMHFCLDILCVCILLTSYKHNYCYIIIMFHGWKSKEKIRLTLLRKYNSLVSCCNNNKQTSTQHVCVHELKQLK